MAYGELELDYARYSFYAFPNGFDKYRIRKVGTGNWRWIGDRWQFNATAMVLQALHDEFGTDLKLVADASDAARRLMGDAWVGGLESPRNHQQADLDRLLTENERLLCITDELLSSGEPQDEADEAPSDDYSEFEWSEANSNSDALEPVTDQSQSVDILTQFAETRELLIEIYRQVESNGDRIEQLQGEVEQVTESIRMLREDATNSESERISVLIETASTAVSQRLAPVATELRQVVDAMLGSLMVAPAGPVTEPQATSVDLGTQV